MEKQLDQTFDVLQFDITAINLLEEEVALIGGGEVIVGLY